MCDDRGFGDKARAIQITATGRVSSTAGNATGSGASSCSPLGDGAMKKHTKNLATRQRGFTMLEVLISVVVLSIGLLGIASLQATGQRNNHSAYLRSQATTHTNNKKEHKHTKQVGFIFGANNVINTT